MNKITAIIVTYSPSIEQLSKMVSVLKKQVDHILIVDNSEDEISIELFEDKKIEYIYLNGNKGIAYAQNVGFFKSVNRSDFVITFDQDSNPPLNLVDKLVCEYYRLVELGVKVACIGPTVINERDGTTYQKYFNGSTCIDENTYNVRSLISSGTLYPIDSFISIGVNKSDWFIDSIDIEWCYRARSLGYNVVMTKLAFMKHNLGAGDRKLIGGKKINYGAPVRLYYVYRNWVFSIKEQCFPLKYKAKLLVMIPLKFIIFSTIPPKRTRAKYMIKGLIDGLLNRGGKISS